MEAEPRAAPISTLPDWIPWHGIRIAFGLEARGAAIVRQIGDPWEDYEQLDYSRGRKARPAPTQLLAGSESLIRCKT